MVETREPLTVHCGKCEHEWAIGFLPMPINALAKLAKGRCPACQSSRVKMGAIPRATADGDAIGWLSNGDTGISSETIWRVMMGRSTTGRQWDSWPSDPDDFGRCYRLLLVMPSWRARLGEVAQRFPKTPWVALVEKWADVERLFLEETGGALDNWSAPKTYELMKELGC
jgi:hypothetical protein